MILWIFLLQLLYRSFYNYYIDLHVTNAWKWFQVAIECIYYQTHWILEKLPLYLMILYNCYDDWLCMFSFINRAKIIFSCLFQVQNLVAIELSYINTKHPDFHEANLFQRSQELEISKNFNEFHVNNESSKDNKV